MKVNLPLQDLDVYTVILIWLVVRPAMTYGRPRGTDPLKSENPQNGKRQAVRGELKECPWTVASAFRTTLVKVPETET